MIFFQNTLTWAAYLVFWINFTYSVKFFKKADLQETLYVLLAVSILQG